MIIFDLDKTIWDCYDAHGNDIWAKQMISPFKKSQNTIIDDVGSKCILKPGILDYLKWLKKKRIRIFYCSVGAYYNLPKKFQPSLMLLNKFGILKMFDLNSVLKYKDFDKNLFLKKVKEASLFFDDNDKIIKKASLIKNLRVYDAKEINDWKYLIKSEIC